MIINLSTLLSKLQKITYKLNFINKYYIIFRNLIERSIQNYYMEYISKEATTRDIILVRKNVSIYTFIKV